MADREAPSEAAEISLPPAEEFAGLSDQTLEQLVQMVESAERELRDQMAPFQLRLAKLAKDAAVVQTEVRRRERQRHIQARREVRTQVSEGEAPSLGQLVEMAELPPFGEPSFADLTFLLESGVFQAQPLALLRCPHSVCPPLRPSQIGIARRCPVRLELPDLLEP